MLHWLKAESTLPQKEKKSQPKALRPPSPRFRPHAVTDLSLGTLGQDRGGFPVKGTHLTREENREMTQITKNKFGTSIVEHTQLKHGTYSVEETRTGPGSQASQFPGFRQLELAALCVSGSTPETLHKAKEGGGGRRPLSICKQKRYN